MLGNLMPPVVRLDPPAVAAVDVVTRSGSQSGGFFVAHPRYRTWLTRCGVVTAADALDLPGEVVSGHPDRHVCRVELNAGGRPRAVFLKREHRVGPWVRLKNQRAGFGWISRSEREAKTLQQLEDAGLPGPAWMAYGEDGRGRAFVLIDELTGSAELRDLLADEGLTRADRRAVADRIGTTIAGFHAAGFGTPDLSAKHVFVRPGTAGVTVIDWPSAVKSAALPQPERVRALAALSASLAEELASPGDRLRAARAYAQVSGTSLKDLVRAVRTLETSLRDRPSLRDQRQPTRTQRLIWLAGEAVVVVPDLADEWPDPADAPPFYPKPFEPVAVGRPVPLTLPDGRNCSLLRYRGRSMADRITAAVRGRVWRSPAARLARVLFHFEKCGVPTPRLLAFGQREQNGRAESFLLHDLPADALDVRGWQAGPGISRTQRRTVLSRLGVALRNLHDAGYVANPDAAPFRVTGRPSRVVIDPTAGVARVRTVSDARRRADVRRLLAGLGKLTRTDIARVVRGYRGTDDRFAALLRKVVVR